MCCAGPWFNEIDSVRRFTNNCVARVYRESCDLPSNRFIYYSRIAQENWVENMESAKEVTDPTISYYFIKSFSNLREIVTRRKINEIERSKLKDNRFEFRV